MIQRTGGSELRIGYPEWAHRFIEPERLYATDEEKMLLAIGIARENIAHGGGPFGAAVIESESGRLISIGMNLVVPLGNSVLHAEIVAVMMAQAAVGSHTLDAPGAPRRELVTSCAPCAMCLGASLWSGARRILYGATREDAMRIGFDEGPVFPESYRYLEERGIEIAGGVMREEARRVLEEYAQRGGAIYNARR